MTSRTVDRLREIAQTDALKRHLSVAAAEQIDRPVRFQDEAGDMVRGYPADALAAFCEAIRQAESEAANALRLPHVVLGAESILSGMDRPSELGRRIASTTGFPEFLAMQHVLMGIEKDVQPPLRAWLPTFPVDFFKQLCRLKGMPLMPTAPPPPGLAASIEETVARRLPTRVYRDLGKRKPSRPPGKGWSGHQPRYFTENQGHEGLRRHLASVVALMRAADDHEQFKRMLDRATEALR